MKSKKVVTYIISGIIGFFVGFVFSWGVKYYRNYKHNSIDEGIQNAVCFEYLTENSASAKNIILVPMTHIGTLEFAENLRVKLDSLRQIGYVIFKEMVMVTHRNSDTSKYYLYNEARFGDYFEEDPDNDLIIYLKERRILGAEVEWVDSLRSRNQSMTRSDRNMEFTYISDELLGIGTSGQDYWIDYTSKDLLDLTEQKYGEIKLTQYDYDTPIEKGFRYNPPLTLKKIFLYPIEHKREKEIRRSYNYDFRDEFLYSKIKNAPFDKIVVIYGAAHIRKLEKWMSADSRFTKVEGFSL